MFSHPWLVFGACLSFFDKYHAYTLSTLILFDTQHSIPCQVRPSFMIRHNLDQDIHSHSQNQGASWRPTPSTSSFETANIIFSDSISPFVWSTFDICHSTFDICSVVRDHLCKYHRHL